MTIYQRMYQHDVMVLKFKDWGRSVEDVRAGSPITVTLSQTGGGTKEYNGYVHHINSDFAPGKNHMEVVAVGASFPMKQQSQTIYKGKTADQVVREIATKHGFAALATAHPRVFPQIAHAGHTDWQMLVRLAKQVGYLLRAENTELYFQPLLEDFKNLREEAPAFRMRGANNPEGSTIYKFTPTIGESIDWDGNVKSATAISGTDKATGSAVSITKQKRNAKTKTSSQLEFFDRFDTHVVAPDAETAQYESEAAEARQVFPYRGHAEVLGHPQLRVGMPIFLDGIGSEHSGFWTVLGVEHKIIEKSLNTQVYTSIVEVGTDSTGQALPYEGVEVVKPNDKSSRKIIPNVPQTKVKPKSKLVKSGFTNAKPIPKSNKASFGKISNRAKPANGPKSIKPAVWKTATPNLNPIKVVEKSRTPAVTARLAKGKK